VPQKLVEGVCVVARTYLLALHFTFLMIRSACRRRKKQAAPSHDAVIRVYDDAGNMIETHNPRGISKNGKRSGALLIIQNRLRRGLAHLKSARDGLAAASCELTF